jgi:amino acid adenylation domain-containing protein/non-ribosomal peptide synthase protein (TIGR01720 family)
MIESFNTSKIPGANSEQQLDGSELLTDEQNLSILNGKHQDASAGDTTLEGIVANPELLLSELPLLTESERHQLLVEWNNTFADYPQNKCIHQLFEAQVEQNPDAVAVVFEDQQLTYRELNCRTNKVAHYLQALGVKPEVLVGICVERSLEMVVGILGILKAGGAYVPLDPVYPGERLAFMLEDSSVPVLLTQQRLVDRLPKHEAQVVCLDAQWEIIAQHSEENIACGVIAENLAYVIYTSGSTGKPKGVTIQHRSLVNYIHAVSIEYEIEKRDRILQFSSISFDVSAEEIYTCLTCGATLVLRTDSMLNTVGVFLQQCRNWEITVLALPTAYWHELTAFLSQENFVLPPSLRLVIIGGEKALPERLKTWIEYVGQRVRLVNNYGPTEATVGTTIYDLSAANSASTEVLIGRPISNVQTYILDRYQQPVPIGVPGQLYIGGDGLARGYLNRPDLTQERFIRNPFSNEPSSRLYKTGDLARYLPDGNIEFVGRYDEQVKIRGFRIELGEIETVLSAQPTVEAVVVIAREDVPDEKRLVAYIVPKKDEINQVSAKSMRNYLADHLPDYMIPSAFVTLPALPITPNGKIDRRALPAPSWRGSELEENFVAPRTTIEEVLAGIWVEVLRVERVGIHDNFLELGGHSLLAIQVISRVRDTLGVELPLRCLFEAPTVAELAQYVETVGKHCPKLLFPPIQPVARTQNLPLSFGQEQLWILHQLASDTPVYNEPSTIRLPGNVNIAALEKALNEIVKRHEILRTTYKMVDGQPYQAIAPSLSVPLPVVDLRSLPTSEREAEALRLATQEARQPFDLTSGPLLRATLMQLDETDYRLFLAAHHIVDDGISSYSVFLPELQTLYQAFCAGFPSPLKELPIQYADFAVWQRQWLQSEVLEPQLAYWKQQLADLPVLQLPTDRPRTARQSFRGSRQCLALSRNLTDELLALSRREGVTLFMTLLAAFKTLLYRYTGADDIPVGTVTGSRNRPELEGSIGFFLNTLVLRTDLSGNPSFLKLLERVREVTLEADAHRDLPFEHLVQTLQPERSSSQNPLFQVSFVLEPPMPALDSGWNMSQLDVDTGTAKFDLTLELDERPEGIIGRIEYSTDLFESSTISRMIGHFQALLEGIVANPIARISDLPLLTETERHQLLVEWNNTTTDYPQDKCIHQLFEEQVERIPSSVAVVFEGEQLTYGELNRRANKLAHYLQSLGVGPEVLVGICVERSLEMIVGLLGILKAGGAYVPIDPAYPPERLAYILSDSRLPVLLTQQKLVASLPEHQARVVYLDTDWEKIYAESELSPISGATPENLAYVIYTSGSTGKPKGVLIPHSGLLNLMIWHQRAFQVTSSDRATQLAGTAFDASVWELWPYLAAGASIYLVEPEILLSPEKLRDWLVSKEITITFVPTPIAEKLLFVQWPKDDVALRIMLTGGDKLYQYPSASIPFKLVNNYGPTENTVVTTSGLVGSDGTDNTSPHIGRPIDNVQIYILDRYLQPVPIGVPGELHIASVGLAKGYLNRPNLTDEKFIPNPFSNEPGSRLYKTGDNARYLLDGNIEFLGRIDHQVKIRGFRIELGEIEAALAQHPAVRETVVVAQEDAPGRKYLAAYIVSNQSSPLASSDLRDFLKEKLPNYMVPGAFVMLDALPLTPNGKVDRRALPMPSTARQELEAAFVAARTWEEELLTRIWREVLHLEKVGIHDNFFELGGDSILSIQIISKANQAGLQLTPKQIFEYQTIAELAAVAIATPSTQAEQGLVSGLLPLTPIQHWFFEQNLPCPHHWNQAFLLEVQRPLDPALLQQAVQQLLVHHDALRLRFTRSESGWQQTNALPDEAVPFSLVDLSALPETEQAFALESKATELQATLNLTSGPLVRVALFNLGSSKSPRLLLVIHHLAVDGVSWRILLEDLLSAYQQLETGSSIELPPKTTSFKHWAEQLTEYARSWAARKELTYWQSISRTQITRLPVDCTEGANTEASARTVSVSLNLEETRTLLQEVPKAYRTQINDVLLTALVQVLAAWGGSSSVLVDLEGHGREDILSDVDLSRTVGWFTTIFPVLLKLEATDNLGDTLKSIKEQLRSVPNRGIGYGLLRYLSGDVEITSTLQALPIPEVSFNYLGQFDWGMQAGSLFKLAPESIGPEHSQLGHRSHLLNINGIVVEGQLQLDWTYSENFHQRATIERWAQEYIEALRALIAHCKSPAAAGYTPSDFPLFKLDQQQLDRLQTRYPDIEDIYPLSPMQHLFYALGVFKSEVGFEYWQGTLKGNLNLSAFQQAWQQASVRHPILRTAFVSEGLDKTIQIVFKHVNLPWKHLDWRELSPLEQEQQLGDFLQADRDRGFDLSSAPLMRITLIRTNDDTYELIWSFQHLILDGWSWPLVLKEVFALYKAFCEGRDLHLERSRPYRDYIAWLQQQDQDAAEAFWRQALAGVRAPNSLTAGNSSSQEEGYAQLEIQLSTAVTQELQALARKHQLTLSTLVQGAWALLVSRYSGDEDVIFGTAVSGRPASLERVDSMVGMFINNLPVRVWVGGERSLISWLQQLQEQLVELRQYEHTPLVQIQQWSEVPGYLRLFESLVVFQNYRTDVFEQEQLGSLDIGDVRGSVRTNYPLTVMALPSRELSLIFAYERRCFDEATITQMIKDLLSLLEGMVANPQLRLQELLDILPLPSNRKVDRNTLLTPDQKRSESESVFVAPRDALEIQLTQIWEAVFGIHPIGVKDNFFELGGHSLLATQLISRIREAFSIEISLHHLFEAPTIASLSKAIETARLAGSQEQSSSSMAFDTLPPLVAGARDTYIPLSFAQQTMWDAQQFYPDSCAANSPIALRFTGELSPEVLEYSINEIIRRHEILRTTFTIKEGQPVQVIAPSLTLLLKIVDLQDLPAAEREASAQKLAAEEFQHHFDLASGPLIKTTLLRLTQEEHWLLITMHHIITDGWSFGILLQELGTLYNAFSLGLPSPLPEVPVQYADFTLWERKWFNEEVLEKQLSYWLKKLADLPTSLDLLPTFQPQPSCNSRRASFYSIVLPYSLVASIEALSRSQGVSIFVIILTALKILLFKWSGQTDILVLAATANRSTPSIEKMLGCFINDVLLRSQVDGTQTGITLLEQVKQTVNEAINHQEIPLFKVTEAISELEFIRTVSVSMAPPIHGHEQILECEVASVPLERELWDENHIPLELYISYQEQESKTIEIQGCYSTNLFTQETIERLFSSYQEILQKLVEHPETKLSELEWAKDN